MYLWNVEHDIKHISLVGYGNVGSHLCQRFKEIGIEVTHILVRNPENVDHTSSKVVTSYDDLPRNQLAIVCVPDSQIKSVVTSIGEHRPVAYTSGSVELSTLPSMDTLGVFYPLQTFSKNKPVEIEKVPFFIEANSEAFAKDLFQLASRMSQTVNYANSEERKKIHLTAVWVNNFTNHILHHAKEYADANDVEFKHLLPLLDETIKKLTELTPQEAQTGPARRGDLTIIEQHINALDGRAQQLYALLSQSIQETYQND